MVNYSQLCSFRPTHTQFPSILHDLKSFYHVKKHSIELWLVSNSSYWPDRIKEKKNCTFFKFVTGKNFKIVCRNKVFLVFKNVQNLFFTPRFLLSFFRLLSLVSHHPEILEKLFYMKDSAFFSCFLWWTITNCVHLEPCTPNFDQFDMTGNHLTMSKKQFYCLHRMVVGLKLKLPTRQNREKQKLHFFKIPTGKNFKVGCPKKVLLDFKNVQNLFFYTKISSLFL